MLTKEQKIINIVQDDLPIKVLPNRQVLPKLREIFTEHEINLDTVFEMLCLIDNGIAGGITAEICPLDFDRSTAKSAFLSSITHFRIKVGEKHFTLLEKYRQDRIRDLKRQDAFNPFRR